MVANNFLISSYFWWVILMGVVRRATNKRLILLMNWDAYAKWMIIVVVDWLVVWLLIFSFCWVGSCFSLLVHWWFHVLRRTFCGNIRQFSAVHACCSCSLFNGINDLNVEHAKHLHSSPTRDRNTLLLFFSRMLMMLSKNHLHNKKVLILFIVNEEHVSLSFMCQSECLHVH